MLEGFLGNVLKELYCGAHLCVCGCALMHSIIASVLVYVPAC